MAAPHTWAAFVAWVVASHAVSKIPPPLHGPPELEQLRYFDGAWHCETRVPATPAAPEHVVKTSLQIKLDIDRSWYTVRQVEERAGSHGGATWAGFWGYDATTHQFVRLGVASGGAWETASAAGWTGDDWVWTGEDNRADGRKVLYRLSISKKEPKQFVDKLEINTDGAWQAARGPRSCAKP